MKTKPVMFTQSQLVGNVEADYHPGDKPCCKETGVAR
jgi:hypothetical protein